MPTISTILSWDARALDPIGDQLVGRRRTLLSLQDELDDGAPPPSWLAPAADRARREHRRLATDLGDLVAEVSMVIHAIDTAVETVKAAVGQLDDAAAGAHQNGFLVDPTTGVVQEGQSFAPSGPSLVGGINFQAPPSHLDLDRLAALDAFADRIRVARRNALNADFALARVLNSVHEGAVSGGGGSLVEATKIGDGLGGRAMPLPLLPFASEAEWNTWWGGLTVEEQDTIINDAPGLIHNADGIPAWARDRANRNLMDDYRLEMTLELKDLEAGAADQPFDPVVLHQMAVLKDKLRGLDAIEETLEKDDRQLLVLDIRGAEQLRAAVAVGDVDTADNVAVFTPGFTTTVHGSLAKYDENMAHLKKAAEDQSYRHGNDAPTTATVTWIGYEAPQWDTTLSSQSVASSSAAETGGTALAGFFRGIDASRESNPHLTALGHSYGSTTTGYALQQQTGVDDVVFFGSPGIGTSDASNLDVPEGHIYRIEAAFDPVADLGAFSGDPSHISGISGLSAEETTIEGSRYGDSHMHSDYLTDHTTSQYNMASVIAGTSENLVHDGGRGFGDIHTWFDPRVH